MRGVEVVESGEGEKAKALALVAKRYTNSDAYLAARAF